jgi:hypothetical protein
MVLAFGSFLGNALTFCKNVKLILDPGMEECLGEDFVASPSLDGARSLGNLDAFHIP